MKNNKHNASKFFAEYFNISLEEAKNCNHITIDMMVKYCNKINKICQTKKFTK